MNDISTTDYNTLFNPHLHIGQEISNSDLVSIFHCGNMGGMRRSHDTNTLVLISDYTKGLYHDKWIGGVLHYTGMGKNGDQDIHWAQNATLANCRSNGVDVHLFEVMDEGRYTYCGHIELVDKPYTETQPGEDGVNRLVWMFPIRPVPENDVKKPSAFVFKDWEDYQKNGKDVDAKYNAGKKTKVKKTASQYVRHKKFGEGVVIETKGNFIIVNFVSMGRKQLNLQLCLDKGLIEFIEKT